MKKMLVRVLLSPDTNGTQGEFTMRHHDRNTLFFKIPDSQEIKARLVEAIPLNWKWVDGFLRVPQDLLDSGMAVPNVGFELRRSDLKPRLITTENIQESKGTTLNLFNLIVERRSPSFVSFQTAGYDEPQAFARMRTIIIGLLRKGYCGHTNFFMNDCHHNYYDNPARCSMMFNPWRRSSTIREPGSVGNQPARLKLEWNERYGGERRNIESIETVCHDLGLRKYVPVPSVVAQSD